MATRHLLRTVILQTLYEWDFYKHTKDITAILERNMKEFAPGVDEPEFAWRILSGIAEHLPKIDETIVKNAPNWPLDKIAGIDRNVLRIGIYELLFADHEEVPPKVAINESVELAKNYGGPNAARFVNGVLGSLYVQMEEQAKKTSS
jgi:N utilization substance protein B